jgi:G3E family GTPase
MLNSSADVICGVGAFSLERTLSLDEHFLEGTPGEVVLTTEGGSHEHSHSHSHAHAPHGDRAHLHTALGFGTVGLQNDQGPLDWAALNKWLQKLCDEHADALCRMKAVLWCIYEGRETRVVVQGTYGQ